ncbi:DUF3267 domain-containing protein [Aquibacillus sp. 3ASR75-11]|uniref:DUF3267 domain-containing protein n=1 Tax=Terrihalobacillus insolitus TaxID=2950438 RepID=A0A9X4ALW1_9BACI|nr:DUF3267 domain-containing protein [Terrihalobacillus insolitus]MDC3414708.1 DUF3267 domain-containing protein [Terrihalobacillus insolitus]MDC3424179.1 DUF3267 domain-containing protein [Terrihalobacillus insolitus]
MKIRNGMPKTDNKTHLKLLENDWIPIKEPKSVGTAVLLSIPFMVLNTFITVGVIDIFSSVSLNKFGLDLTSDSLSITINLVVIIWLFLLIVIHELIHLVFIPNFIKSKKTFIGLTLFGGYVITEEKISKSRYILVTISPFVIISVFLPIILSLFGILTPTFKILILVNSMASSVDILNLIHLLVQIPKRANLISNGNKTYWKYGGYKEYKRL